MAIQIGIAPLTWTNDDLPELGGETSFEQCIQEMADAGYAGCEIGNKFPRDTKTLLAALKPYNLQIISQWCSLYFTVPGREQEMVERFEEHLAFLKSVGAKLINVCEKGGSIQWKSVPILGNQKPVFDDSQWDSFITGLHKLGKIAVKNGMRMAYHQHMGTGVQNETELNRLMQNTDPALVDLLFDTAHIDFAGMNPLDVISRYGDRIGHVHLKDMRNAVIATVKEKQMSFLDCVRAGAFTVPGDGDMNFKPITDALIQQGFTGWFLVEAEQDPAKAHPLTYAKKGREYIKQITGL